MQQRKTKIRFAALLLLVSMLACNYVAPVTPRATTQLPPTAIVETASLPLTVIVEPTSSIQATDFPFTEATLPRVSLEEAVTAWSAGAAVIVDVRSYDAYVSSHIKGAISIPLADIESNPNGLNIDKDEWIITYCT
jgi:hypothetical protein